MSRSSHSASAFTLVELMVVLAVVAMLVAMLLPALAKSRLAAANVKCQSNQRQLALGAAMYGGDNDNYYLPPHRRDTTPKSHHYPKSSVPQDGLAVMGYISRTNRAWVCPLLEDKKIRKTGWGARLYGYATTALHGTYNPPEKRMNNRGPYRERDLVVPDNTILFGDVPIKVFGPGDVIPAPGDYYGEHMPVTLSGNDRALGNQQTWDNTWKPGVWTHLTGVYLAMWDGHVEFEDYTLYDWSNVNKSLRKTQVRMRANPKLGNDTPF